MKYPTILAAIHGQPWAITPGKLEAIIHVLSTHQRGVVIDAERWEVEAASRAAKTVPRGDGVAVLGLHGTITQRPTFEMMQGSGGTSTDRFGAAFDAAMNSNDVGAIVIDADTPGGSVFGVSELGAKIFAARGIKPIFTVVNSEMHSAGYWIGSQADKVYVTPGGVAGSIGVVMAHVDQSGADEKQGVKVEFLHAGSKKVDGHPHGPLTDDARNDMMAMVNTYYAAFQGAVAKGRGVSIEAVRKDFGDGGIFTAKELVSRNMADGIATLDDVIRMAAGEAKKRSRNAERRQALDALKSNL